MNGWVYAFAPWTGAVVGGFAWAAATQAGLVLPNADCAAGGHWTLLACLAAALAALGGAAASWRTTRRPEGTETRGFTGRLSALAGLLFAFALTLQGVATVLAPACAR